MCTLTFLLNNIFVLKLKTFKKRFWLIQSEIFMKLQKLVFHVSPTTLSFISQDFVFLISVLETEIEVKILVQYFHNF